MEEKKFINVLFEVLGVKSNSDLDAPLNDAKAVDGVTDVLAFWDGEENGDAYIQFTCAENDYMRLKEIFEEKDHELFICY